MIQQAILLFIGGTEIVFMRTLRDATNDIKHEVTKSAKENNIIDTDVAKDIQEEITKIKDDLSDFTGSVKRKL